MQTCACCPCWSGIGSEFFTVLENGDLLACCAPCLESSRRASTWKDGKLIFESRYSRYFSGRPTCQVYCSAGCWTFVQKTLILSPHAHLVVVKKKVKRINSLFDKRPVVQVSKKSSSLHWCTKKNHMKLFHAGPLWTQQSAVSQWWFNLQHN